MEPICFVPVKKWRHNDELLWLWALLGVFLFFLTVVPILLGVPIFSLFMALCLAPPAIMLGIWLRDTWNMVERVILCPPEKVITTIKEFLEREEIPFTSFREQGKASKHPPFNYKEIFSFENPKCHIGISKVSSRGSHVQLWPKTSESERFIRRLTGLIDEVFPPGQ